jgi:hypothetical protein
MPLGQRYACVAQKVLASPQVHRFPVICTQKAPMPWLSAHCWWLVQPHEGVGFVDLPQRSGPPPNGWKHLRSPGH